MLFEYSIKVPHIVVPFAAAFGQDRISFANPHRHSFHAGKSVQSAEMKGQGPMRRTEAWMHFESTEVFLQLTAAP